MKSPYMKIHEDLTETEAEIETKRREIDRLTRHVQKLRTTLETLAEYNWNGAQGAADWAAEFESESDGQRISLEDRVFGTLLFAYPESMSRSAILTATEQRMDELISPKMVSNALTRLAAKHRVNKTYEPGGEGWRVAPLAIEKREIGNLYIPWRSENREGDVFSFHKWLCSHHPLKVDALESETEMPHEILEEWMKEWDKHHPLN